MSQELSEETRAILKRLVISLEWETCKDLWGKLLIRKEKEKSDSLRPPKLDESRSSYLQGFIDGQRAQIAMVESVVRSDREVNNEVVY